MSDDSHGIFIDVEVDDAVADDAELAAKLAEVCPVDIFAADGGRVEVVRENLDECVLCDLCVDAAPAGGVVVKKLYDGTELAPLDGPRRVARRAGATVPPAMNFVEDVLERFPAARPALVAIDADGERRVWGFGELIARSAGLAGRAGGARGSAAATSS